MTNARLIEPSGTPGIVVSMDDALKFCKIHPTWSWETCSEQAISLPVDELSEQHNVPVPLTMTPDLSKAPSRPGCERCEDELMPFGKHRGKPLGQILVDEPSYLDWLFGKANLRDGSLKDAVREMNEKYQPEIEKGVEEARERFFAQNRRRFSSDD